MAVSVLCAACKFTSILTIRFRGARRAAGHWKPTRLSREFSADKGTLRASGGRKAYGSRNGACRAHLRLGRVTEVRHTVRCVRLKVRASAEKSLHFSPFVLKFCRTPLLSGTHRQCFFELPQRTLSNNQLSTHVRVVSQPKHETRSQKQFVSFEARARQAVPCQKSARAPSP